MTVDLDKLQALADAATKGPWTIDRCWGNGAWNLAVYAGDSPVCVLGTETSANLGFIVACRASVPELIAEVRRLRAELHADVIVEPCAASSKESRERWQSHMKGWRDGASPKSMDKAFTEHKTRPDLKAAYEAGYTKGWKGKHLESQHSAKLYGYEPSVLRAQESEAEEKP